MSDVDGKLDQAKGRVKEAAGDLTDDDDLKREGKVDRASGSVKDTLADAKDRAEDAVDAVKDTLTGNR
jgi:uncharacterized protein YjbJ (UPF0337 family)